MMPKIIKTAGRLNHCDLLSAKGTKDIRTKFGKTIELLKEKGRQST